MLLSFKGYLRGVATVVALLCSGAQARDGLELTGLAVYTETARDIYVAGLLLPPDSGVANLMVTPPPKGMAYHIATRRISSRGFSGTLLLQAELGSGERAPEPVIAALGELKSVIKSSLLQGDQFEIHLSEEDVTTFYLNGVELLAINDGGVFDFFFAGWVGESSSALFRDSLLSGKLNPDTVDRFNRLAPAESRVALVDEWMQPEPEPVPEPEPEPVQVAAVAEVASAAPGGVAAAAGGADAAAATVATEETTEEATAVATGTETASDPETTAPIPVASIPAGEQVASAAAVMEAPAEVVTEEEPAAAPLDDREYQQQLRDYTSQVMRLVYGKVKYPKRAVKNDWEGRVELLARMDAGGELIEVTVDSTSGHRALDRAAGSAVEKAAPFPELGQAAKEELIDEDGETFIMSIPVTFRLNR